MEKQFQVECDDCPFERAVEGRERAEGTAQDHTADTGHDVLVVELPPTLADR